MCSPCAETGAGFFSASHTAPPALLTFPHCFPASWHSGHAQLPFVEVIILNSQAVALLCPAEQCAAPGPQHGHLLRTGKAAGDDNLQSLAAYPTRHRQIADPLLAQAQAPDEVSRRLSQSSVTTRSPT